MRSSTDENIAESSEALINEMGSSIENYLTQFEKGLAQMISSPTVLGFNTSKQDEEAASSLEAELGHFLTIHEAASSVYYSLPTKDTTILPVADLGADFDPTSRARYQVVVVNDTEMTFSEISTLMADMQDSIDSVSEEITTVATLKDDVAETIQTMAATSQETAAACEEVSASTDEQLRATHSVTDAAEALTNLSEELNQAVKQFKV